MFVFTKFPSESESEHVPHILTVYSTYYLHEQTIMEIQINYLKHFHRPQFPHN
jgi:hypothetical protein